MGKFYVWKKSELDQIIPKEDKDLFYYAYGVTAKGNFEDNHPITAQIHKNVVEPGYTINFILKLH